VRLEAGGSRLDVISVDLDESSGAGTATAYPIARKERSVRIEFVPRGRSGTSGRADIRVDLP
jgi:hypothetical protein